MKPNKQYMEIAVYILLIILAAIMLEKLLSNFTVIIDNITTWLGILRSILSPFIYGIFIAYFFNVTMSWMEKNIFNRVKYLEKRDGAKRIASLSATYIVLLGCIIWIVAYLVPEVVLSVKNLLSTLPSNVNYFTYQFNNVFENGNLFDQLLESVNKTFSTVYTPKDIIDLIFKPVMDFAASVPTIVGSLIVGTYNAAQAILNFVLGLFIAFYILSDKENISALFKKILYTIFKKETASKIIEITQSSNNIFRSFFIGKVIDSVIIGIMFFVIAILVKAPYPLLLSLIIGITNVIPYFGPFIGAIPVVIIVLLNNLNNPMSAVWMALIIFVLQQFDGIYLGPKILGESIGVRPLLVILAILVGGALMGVPGMFFGVPVLAILRNLFMALINKKYDKKYSGLEKEGQ